MTITGRVERVLVLGAIAVLGAVLLAADALAKKDRTSLVSRQSASASGLGGDDESFNPAVSANGRFVAFETHADNLGGPAVDVANIYVYDRERKKVELVSRRSKSAGGAGGDGDSFLPSISKSGRFVAFETESENLGGPPVDFSQIYLYDRKRDRIRLVSRRSQSAGGAAGDDGSFNGVVSGNGRFVAFETNADNLGGPIADFTNIYVHDVERKKVSLVSRQSRGAGGLGGDADSFNPDITDTGNGIAFETDARNLGGPIATPLADQSNVYVYDRGRTKVTLVSRRSKSAGGGGGNEDSEGADIAGGGRFVAFETDATNLGGPIATAPDDDNVYVFDMKRKKVQFISRRSKGAGGGGANGLTEDVSISANGRLAAFETAADNLGGPIATLAGDTNVYVYNLERKKVVLVSRRSKGAGGQGGDDESEDPAIAPSGPFVAFESEAQNLGGPNQLLADEENIYLHTLR
jgi:Tol biopolymer transport system component